MLYIDYNFDLEDGYILFDDELHLASQEKKPDRIWGTLPKGWKDGDMFKLQLNGSGRVMLVKATQPNGGL
jgi:hypothetical protein